MFLFYTEWHLNLCLINVYRVSHAKWDMEQQGNILTQNVSTNEPNIAKNYY